MRILAGIPASPGIAICPGFIYSPQNGIPLKKAISDPDEELQKFRSALQTAGQELEATYQSALQEVGEESAEIFRAHLMILADPELLERTEHKMIMEGCNCEAAFYDVAEEYARTLDELPDEYLRSRAADVRDINRRMIRIMSGNDVYPRLPSVQSIIVAEDLLPSDTMRFERDLVGGFYTAHGGATSHTAILARSLGVPAVVGGGQIPAHLPGNTHHILDGDEGRLILDPDAATLAEYQERSSRQRQRNELEKMAASEPAVTRDGRRVEMVANIGSLEDARQALLQGAEGVGLFRTEFSYIEKQSVPSEAELFESYQGIFQLFGDLPIVVRTLDIGGDKEIPHLGLPVEANPFLGVRGIRLCLQRPDLFKPQLRAILKAGCGSNVHIMFPMVSTPADVRNAREYINACISELEKEGWTRLPAPKIGIMIEVPAAAVCADRFAREVDFFSIGTNDLTQYTLAVDRTNANLAEWSQGIQPAVLRLIKMVIDSAHEAGIWVGMCGEMAGEPIAIPILLGLGLDEFSMNPKAIPGAKQTVRQWETAGAKLLAEQALQCGSSAEVKALVRDWK